MTTSKIIENKIAEAIVNDPLLRGSSLEILVSDDRVVLSGVVNQYKKIYLVEKVATAIGHPRLINQSIAVVPDIRRNDDYILDEIVSRLKINLGFSSEKALVTVQNGIVHLQGQMPWSYQRDLAAQAISDVDGICDIQNDLTVSPVSNDQIIKRQILDILPMVTSNKIDVEIAGSNVVLKGAVSSFEEKNSISNAIMRISHIGQIRNELIVYDE